MKQAQRDYIGFSDADYRAEANVLQQRINTRRVKGEVVTSDQAWEWIKERKPGWFELDWEKVFKLLRL
jgi:hypothetical protein